AQVETRLDNQELDTGPRSGPAPDFALPSLADSAVTIALADYRGQPVVVNFWASWCVPCRREIPRLAAAARRLEGEVAFVGVNYRDSRDDALAFVEQTGVPYPSGVDDNGAVGTRYGLVGMPTTVFVSSDGDIVGRYLGEMSQGTLDDVLDQLVAGR
ncbi:MAG: TlpA family protein disulfide reductase, partial [Acidimicrobiales bacterium]